jgi:hypothetical protein
MKKLLLIAAVVFMYTACKNNSTSENTKSGTNTSEKTTAAEAVPDGRFDFKSGILVTETDMMGMGKSTMTMTFDDYGKHTLTEMKMSMMGKDMITKTIIKDGYAYSWTQPLSMAIKVKLEDNPDDKNIDYKNLTEEMKKKLNMKEEADETIDGKTCKVYSYSMKEGMSGKTYTWKGMPIQTVMNMAGKNIVTKFVSFEENVSIPSSAFDLPADVEFKEMKKTEHTAQH